MMLLTQKPALDSQAVEILMSMLLMSTSRLTKLNNRKSKLLKKLLVIEIMNWELSKLSHQLQLMSQRLQSKLSQYKIRPP
jgi:hypothetical protein